MSHHSNNQIASASDFYSAKPELSGVKSHKLISGMFEGKSPSDYESSWSPTSPLDFRLFSSLANPFGAASSSSASRLIWKGKQMSWDSGKVGLSILHSLDDHHHHTGSSRILLPSPDSKNIIFGSSLIRSGNPKQPHLPSPMVDDFHLLSQQPLAKTILQKIDRPTNGHGVIDVVELRCSASANDISVSNNDCQVIEQTTPGSLTEISEDYTCVISHGPNPKTTHFYGDQVLESAEDNELKKRFCGNKKKSIFEIAPLDLTTPDEELPSNDFLSFCWFCSNELDMGKDIYMYSGFKAFCSRECRFGVIEQHEEMEEEEEEEEEAAARSSSSSEKDMSKKKSNGVIVTVG